MDIKYASIKVKNIEKSLDFYGEILDLDVVDEYYSDSISVVMLTDGNVNLELIDDSTDECGFNNIGFVVSDMDEVINRLDKEGISFDDELVSEDNHIISLNDRDGVKINIIKE